MNDTGCTLKSLATPSYEAATGIPTISQAFSGSTTIGLTTTMTTSGSADPNIQHLDDGYIATEGKSLVESIPQNPAKARQTIAKPKTAAVPTGAVVESGKRIKYAPYLESAYKVYFAVINELGITNECIEPDPINRGGTRDTKKGQSLYRRIYEILK